MPLCGVPRNPRTEVNAPPSRTAGMTSSFSTAPSAQSINAIGEMLPNPSGNIVTPANHNVGPKRFNQSLILFRGICNYPQTLGLCELDNITAVGSGCAGNGNALVRRQVQKIERHACR